ERSRTLAGFSLLTDLERTFAAPPPELAPRVRGQEVTFRARAAAGHRVAVVGDWNGWDAAAQPLAPAGGDLYQATLLLPQGRHEYAVAGDGVAAPPPEAPAC